jgi:hypothetical protein
MERLPRFQTPLIKPDVRMARIRLSDSIPGTAIDARRRRLPPAHAPPSKTFPSIPIGGIEPASAQAAVRGGRPLYHRRMCGE